jgi:ferredoxin
MNFKSLRLACVLCFLCATAHAQNCVTQALGSLSKARSEIVAGNQEKGRQWIEQAALECPTSAIVLRKIADLYQAIGDLEAARSWRERAEAQERGTPLKLQSPIPSTAGAGPAGAAEGCNQLLQRQQRWVREKYAIVVGVSEFHNPAYNLKFAAKDASDFAAALQDPAVGRFKPGTEHVRLLLNENATVSNIRTAINDVARDARAEDLVVMYFSSHGTAAENDVAKDEAKSGYIVTHESDLSNLYATAFPMEELRRVVEKRIRACRVVLFLDTCFSGDTVSPAAGAGSKMLALGISDQTKERIAQGVGRVVIASSRNDERSWESEHDRNSYFTFYLLEALRTKGGLADITTIFTHLQREVPRAVKNEKHAKQTPVMWPEGQRLDIVIGTAID